MDMNVMKLMQDFGTDEKCRKALEELRWPNGPICPKCESESVSQVQKRGVFDCNSCRCQFSVTAGTIFHDTHLPLQKWFMAIYLIVESKKGISANQMKRMIGVSYKTAWYLCHRIRAAMTELKPKKLKGTVEVDETYIGGKLVGSGRGKGNFISNKATVAGIIQRGGDVRMSVIPNSTRKTLREFIEKFADDKTKEIMTDEWIGYNGIGDYNTKHLRVNHSKKEWVRGKNIHTNTIENVWSLLKRSVVGSYHKVSTKHLDAYLDELEWRYNNRDNQFLFRDTLLKLIGAKNLEYQELIAS
jgi:transposase-like protein